eukprot:867537-Alexandrium_andersonii.AAC.1
MRVVRSSLELPGAFQSFVTERGSHHELVMKAFRGSPELFGGFWSSPGFSGARRSFLERSRALQFFVTERSGAFRNSRELSRSLWSSAEPSTALQGAVTERGINHELVMRAVRSSPELQGSVTERGSHHEL